jgi:hypothetical protein
VGEWWGNSCGALEMGVRELRFQAAQHDSGAIVRNAGRKVEGPSLERKALKIIEEYPPS